MAAQRSIVICGGAFAGLALALAFRQGLGADIPVIVADPALAVRPSRDPRATAIVAACRRLFEALGVWDQVAADSQAILDMVVTDSKLEDATRPVFLTFAGDVEPGEPFAHMVENRRLIDALVVRAEAEGIDQGHGGFDLRFAFRWRHRDARRRQCHRGKPAGRR
jgi:2-octaprenyl-6-methoxyphenol hydroxylase